MATEAVTLLKAMLSSMQRIELQGNGLGLNPGRVGVSAAQRAADDVQRMIDEQRNIRLRQEITKTYKSEIFEAARAAKTRDDARKAMIKLTAELNRLQQATTNDMRSVRNIRSVLMDFGKSIRGLTDQELKKMSQHFTGLGGVMSDFRDSVENGDEAVQKWVASVVDQTSAADDLLREWEDLQRGIAKLGTLTQDQTAEWVRRERDLAIKLEQSLMDLTGQSSSGVQDAVSKLRKHVTTVTDDITSSVGQLNTAMISSTRIIERNNAHTTRMGEVFKSFTSNPILKFGAAALGANMLFSKGSDGSSVLGDMTSTFNTGVNTPYLPSANAAAAFGMSIADLKRTIVETAGESAVTKAEMTQIFRDTFATGGTNYRAMLGAFHGDNEVMMARLVQEQALGNRLGASPAMIQEMARQRINIARNMEDAGLGSAQQLLELTDGLIETNESFAILRSQGLKNQQEYQRGFAQFGSRMQLMGLTMSETADLMKRAGEGLNQSFKDRTQGLGKQTAVLNMLGADATTVQRMMKAKLQGDMLTYEEELARAKNQIAPTVERMLSEQRLGSGAASATNIALLDQLNSLGIGGVTSIIGEGVRRNDRAEQISPQKKAELTALINNAEHLNRLSKEADTLTARFQEWGVWISDLMSKNSLASGVGGVAGIATTMIGQALLTRLFMGRLGGLGGAAGGMMSRLNPMSWLRGVGAVGGAGGMAASGLGAAGAGVTGAAGATAGAAGAGTALRSVGRIAGRAAVPLAALTGGYFAYDDSLTRGETQGEALSRGGGALVGGGLGAWGGAAAGAAIGAAFGGVGAIPGAIIGGMIGAWGGSEAGDALGGVGYDAFNDQPENVATPASMVDRYDPANIEHAIAKYGEQTVDELRVLNKGVATLVGFAAAKAVPDRQKRTQLLSRIYRADTQSYASEW